MCVDLKISSAENKKCYFKIIVFLHNDFFLSFTKCRKQIILITSYILN